MPGDLEIKVGSNFTPRADRTTDNRLLDGFQGIYTTRLITLQNKYLLQLTRQRWPGSHQTRHFYKLSPSECSARVNERYCVYGIVYRNLRYRENAVEEYGHVMRYITQEDPTLLAPYSSRVADNLGEVVIQNNAADNDEEEDEAMILDECIGSSSRGLLGSLEDEIFLEDASNRLKLRIVPENFDTVSDYVRIMTHMVPGAVIAVLGNFDNYERFVVDDALFPLEIIDSKSNTSSNNNKSNDYSCSDNANYDNIGKENENELPSSEQSKKNPLLLMTSAMLLCTENENRTSLTYANALADIACGNVAPTLRRKLTEKIGAVVVAGNSTFPPELTNAGVDELRAFKASPSMTFIHLHSDSGLLDTVLFKMASHKPVIIMPGSTDPTNKTLPQYPIPEIYFQQASLAGGYLNLASNPAAFAVNGIRIFGTDGLPVRNLMQCINVYADLQDAENKREVDIECHPQQQKGCTFNLSEMDALQLTLECLLLAPTAPMVLDMQPVISDTTLINPERPPKILFAGGCKKAESRLVKWRVFMSTETQEEPRVIEDETLLVTIPALATTREALVLDPLNLTMTTVRFN